MSIQHSNEFVTFIHRQLGIELPKRLDWTEIAVFVQTLPKRGTSDIHILAFYTTQLTNLIEKQSFEVRTKNKECYQYLLGGILEKIVTDKATLHRLTNYIPALVRNWTANGSDTIPNHIVDKIAPFYKDALHNSHSTESHQYEQLLEGLYYSPQLWSGVRQEVLPDITKYIDAQSNRSILDLRRQLLHRYEPSKSTLAQRELNMAYYTMCGANEPIPLYPSQMQAILTGEHHNATAWLMAIDNAMAENYKHYDDKPDQFETEWKTIAARLSKLTFNPVNPMDWALWMLVHNRQSDATCIADAYATIQSAQPVMNEAFHKYWPLVSTMFDEEDEQQEMAAQYYRESLEHVEGMPQFNIEL